MSIRPVNAEHKSTARKIAGTVATAAVATGAALYLAKTGKLDKFVGKNAHVDKGINGLKDLANKVSEMAKPVVDKVKPAYDKAASKVKPMVDEVAAKVKPTAAKVKNKVKESFDSGVKQGKVYAEKAKNALHTAYTSLKAAITKFVSEKNPADTVVEGMAGKFNP